MIMNDLSKRVEELTVQLTEIPSVSETPGELEISKKIYEIFSNLPYFRTHSEDLRFVTAADGRKSVLTVLRGEKASNKKAVVLLGHFDTVGLSDYGNLTDLATKPYELTKKLKEIAGSLPEKARKDLLSGDYLFGRGIFDMKSGDAAIIALMEEFSSNLTAFDGNIIYAAVCDEEANSAGMLSVVPELVRLREENDFDYQGLIDTDIMTPEYDDDPQKYVYIGSVGKLMPSFYVAGKEAHVGEAFKGLDPNQLASGILQEINLNPDYCDLLDGEVTDEAVDKATFEATLPPVSLSLKDLKTEYSVQLAKTASLYFNYMTTVSRPDEVLSKMIKAAQTAFDKTIRQLNRHYQKYCTLIGREFQPLAWQPHVVSFDELCESVKSDIGAVQFDRLHKNFTAQQLVKDLNEREFALQEVAFVHQLWSNREPVVVVYFSPPYYPSVHVADDVHFLNAVKSAVTAQDKGLQLRTKAFFPYISDMSYAAAPEVETLSSLTKNTPGFGGRYQLPLDAMRTLNLPVVNIGPFGFDAHQFTERLEKHYSFEVLPILLRQTVENLLK